MEKYEVEESKAQLDLHKFWVKALLWLIAISIVGCILCVILAVARVAVEVVVIVAGVLLVVGLIGVVGYNAVKYKVRSEAYSRQLRKQQEK